VTHEFTEADRERMRKHLRAAMTNRAKVAADRSEPPSRVTRWLGYATIVAILAVAFFAWRWFEGYRASIWAAEMRRAGVAAPEVTK
jgi:type VI protein secretion system component VasF